MDRLEFEGLFLLKRRFQVSVALLGPDATAADPALFPLFREIVPGGPLLPRPRRKRVERGDPPRPARHNVRLLRALPADRLQRREERLSVGAVAPAAVALFFEELPHLAAERGLHRLARSAHHAEDEPAPFGAEHAPDFVSRMVYVDVMERARRENRRHAPVIGGPAIVGVSYQEPSAEPRPLHLLTKERGHRRGANET